MAPAEPVSPQRGGIRVEIVHSPCAGRVDRVALKLADGATLGDALRAVGVEPPPGASISVWGRPLAAGTALSAPLADRDRVEFCRPLAVDPMEARRRRAAQQRAAAGAGRKKPARAG